MTPVQLRHSALNLRTRAKTEANAERAAAWLKEAEDLESLASDLEKKPADPAEKK